MRDVTLQTSRTGASGIVAVSADINISGSSGILQSEKDLFT